jgi:hypothetical protein
VNSQLALDAIRAKSEGQRIVRNSEDDQWSRNVQIDRDIAELKEKVRVSC